MRIRNIIIALCGLTALYFLFDSLSQPNPNSLEGNFTETAMYRNPNNTGPVVRIFTVAVEDTLWEEMRQYGEMMPYTKYGTTTVYFFKSGGDIPTQVSETPPHFDAVVQNNCLAKYQKDAMAAVTLVRYPFSKTSDGKSAAGKSPSELLY